MATFLRYFLSLLVIIGVLFAIPHVLWIAGYEGGNLGGTPYIVAILLLLTGRIGGELLLNYPWKK